MRRCAVDLWIWALDIDPEARARLGDLLSEDELERARRLVSARHSERFTVARGRMREILGACISAHPKDLRFSYSTHGKPSLAGPPHFNLSHSESLAVLAVSPEFELGVDIEAVRPVKEDVASRYFSARELAELAALAQHEQLGGFYRCWTRKEAVLKALGDGLARALDSFDVSVASHAHPRLVRMDGEPNAPENWRLAHFEPQSSFTGAVAGRTGGVPIDLRCRRI